MMTIRHLSPHHIIISAGSHLMMHRYLVHQLAPFIWEIFKLTGANGPKEQSRLVINEGPVALRACIEEASWLARYNAWIDHVAGIEADEPERLELVRAFLNSRRLTIKAEPTFQIAQSKVGE